MNFYCCSYGPHSIEVGHELIKYTDVLLGDLQDTTKRSSQYGEKLAEARACLERALQIFELHYGAWHKTHQEIAQKLARISFLNADSSDDNNDDNEPPFRREFI